VNEYTCWRCDEMHADTPQRCVRCKAEVLLRDQWRNANIWVTDSDPETKRRRKRKWRRRPIIIEPIVFPDSPYQDFVEQAISGIIQSFGIPSHLFTGE
jgi:hypothetical protein